MKKFFKEKLMERLHYMDNRRRNSGNRYRPNQYNNSSEAYDYERLHYNNPTIEEQRNAVRLKEQKKKNAIKKQRIVLLKRREQLKRDRLNHILCYILAFYIFGTSVFILNQFDQNNVIETEISQKQGIINEQEKEISAKKIELASSIDVHEIENYARNELGMKTPSQDQLVYVTLPKNRSYIEYNTKDAKEEPAKVSDEQAILDEEKAEDNLETDNTDITNSTGETNTTESVDNDVTSDTENVENKTDTSDVNNSENTSNDTNIEGSSDAVKTTEN